MTSKYFKNGSADHIIPVSLGGVHDSRFLQPMPSGDNSSKRDRLVKDDILKAIEIENKTKINAVSWFVSDLWKYLKSEVSNFSKSDFENFRVCLKQNMTDFLNILCIIKNLEKTGIDFITEKLIQPKMKYFEVDYDFNVDGTYSEKERHITERASEEFERMKRISLDSLDDYNNKDNRNLNADFTDEEQQKISEICKTVKLGKFDSAFSLLKILMKEIQKRELEYFKNQRA